VTMLKLNLRNTVLATLLGAACVTCRASAGVVDIGLWSTGTSNQLLFISSANGKTSVINTQQIKVATVPSYGYEATDAHGNLYVAPVVGGYSTPFLRIFPPPYTKAAHTLNFGQYATDGIAVDNRRGIFAVTTIYAGGGPGGTRIMFFNEDGNVPCKTLTFNGAIANGSAFDHEGTLFATNAGGTAVIAEISGECNATKIVLDTLPLGVYPDELYINKNDDIVFENGLKDVLTYAHPKNGTFGAPVAQTNLDPVDGKTTYFSCLSSDGQYLWAANGDTRSEYRYPQGGAPIFTTHTAPNACLATFPPLAP
jgi:hypothetical protein